MSGLFCKLICYFFASILVLNLISCANKEIHQVPVIESAEMLFKEGESLLTQKKYKDAAEKFALIYNEHPYAKEAIKSKILEAFAYFEKQDFDMVVAILDEFVKLHPSNKDISYAYYLKAMSYYQQIIDIEHDQKNTEQAKESIKELIIRFPDSNYAREAKIKLDLVNDHLAGKEMEIGRFYLNKHDYIAALNRFQKVINKYETTAHVKEALYRLVEINLVIGLNNEAKKDAAILGANYPQSKWYQMAFDLINKTSNAN